MTMAVRLLRQTTAFVEESGYAAALFIESLYWLLVGPRRRQPVRLRAVVAEMREVGVRAAPIVALLALANGIMMALQGIYTLKDFGAESEVIPMVALSVTREFAALIVGIVVAGRSGSAIAARIGSMAMAQEIDALRVMGINPVRYLVAPVLLALMIMVPLLTVLADAMAMLGGGLLCSLQLPVTLYAYFSGSFAELALSDVAQGLAKALVFAILIGLIACSNGFTARGGATGLGRQTTRSVVLCIAAIVISDVVFTFFLSR